MDTENKLVLDVVNGKRTVKNTKRLVQNTAKRLKFKSPRLITSDEYKPYKQAILESFGKQRVSRLTGRFGRVIVFQKTGTFMERQRVLVYTVTIFVGRCGHCGDCN